MSPAARKAHFVLPASTFAEMEGTFTNFEGRVQRFAQALLPPGMARPPWLSGSAVLARLGKGRMFTSAGAAFAGMAQEIDAYRGMSYESIAWHGGPTAGAESGVATAS